MDARYPICDTSTMGRNLAISSVFCLLVVMGFAVASPTILHWSLLPIYTCGVLIGTDAVAFVRRQVDTFDPKGLVGLFGVHFFFLAPLLLINSNLGLIGQVSDARPWLGCLACLNAAGLIAYFIMRNLGARGVPRSARVTWLLAPEKSTLLLPVIILSALSWGYVLVKVGGFSAMIEAHEDPEGKWIYAGTGVPKILASMLPTFLILHLTLMRRRENLRRSTFIAVAVILFLLLIVQFLISGMKGNRSAVMYSFVSFVGIIHYFWRPVTVKHVAIGLIPMVLFMYLYSFYKFGGIASLGIVSGDVTFGQMQYEIAESRGTFSQRVLLSDLSRSDIQAFILYMLLQHRESYDLRWGKTYATMMVRAIPTWIWASPPAAERHVAGTEIQRGRGSFKPNSHWGRSHRVYGLAGEAMLNGSWPAVPLAFGCWGFAIGRLRRRLFFSLAGDARLFFAPLFAMLAVIVLMQDSDLVFMYLLVSIPLPILGVWLTSVRVPVGESVASPSVYAPRFDPRFTEAGLAHHRAGLDHWGRPL
ncbi:MAG: hypothetical protein ABII12_06670 [Planctomycetota bacterium]